MGLAFRAARRDPWHATWVILTLALGIGTSTSAFTVLDHLVFRGPGITKNADELRRVVLLDLPSPAVTESAERTSLSYPEYEAVVDATQNDAEAAGYFDWPGAMTIRVNNELLRARVLGVTTNYFSALGVVPARGRFFANPAAKLLPTAGSNDIVISDAFWRRAFAKRVDVVGTVVEAYHQRFMIVGIAPEGFDGIGLDGPDIWLSGEHELEELYGAGWRRANNAAVWSVILRLRDLDARLRVSREAKDALQIEAANAGSQLRYGDVRLLGLRESLRIAFSREVRFAWALWGISLLVLLTTAINTGSLFLVKGLERQHEYAVISALGSSRLRLVSQLVVEGSTLAMIGALIGIGMAIFGSEIMRRGIGSYVHYTQALIDTRQMLYAAALALLLGAVASVLPAVRVTRADLRTFLDDRGVGSRRDVTKLRALIHSAQIALAVIGLYGASLFVQSGRRARSIDLGMDTDGISVATANVIAEGLSKTEARDFWRRVLDGLPIGGPIEAVALSSLPVIREYAPTLPVNAARGIAASDSGWQGTLTVITPTYHRALRIPIISGRDISEEDRPDGLRVVLINRAGARILFGGMDPIGQCVSLARSPRDCLRVVGVVGDSRRRPSEDEAQIQLYIPWTS